MQFKLIENGDSVRKHDKDVLKQTIFNLKDDEDSYIILEPKKPVGNSIYMQVTLHKRQYKIETRLIFSTEADFKHYNRLYCNKDEVFEVFDNYYTHGKLPDFRSWTDDTSIFKDEEECDMVKLYKEVNGTIHYFEIWIDEENTLISHKGVLGEIGTTQNFSEQDNTESQPPRIAMAKAIKIYKDLGYGEDFKQIELIVQYPLRTKNKQTIINEQAEEVEACLNNCLGWTGNGHCDGGDLSDEAATFFCYVIDKDIAIETILEALDEESLLFENLKIAYADEKTEEYILIYPNEGTFDLI